MAFLKEYDALVVHKYESSLYKPQYVTVALKLGIVDILENCVKD